MVWEHPALWVKKQIEAHGEHSENAVCWWSHGYQFGTIADVIADLPIVEGSSLLDVGGGRCDLFGYLEERIHLGKYRCIDLSPDLLAIAKKMWPAVEVVEADILKYDNVDQFDFVVANGSAFYPASMDPEHGNELLWKFVDAMFDRTRIACAFNVGSTLFQMPDEWYHVHPVGLMEGIVKRTRRFTVKHNRSNGMINVTMWKPW